MEKVLDVINSSDVVSLIVLILVLCWIGSRMVRSRPELGQWGWRLAAAAFIGYCLFMGSQLDEHTPGVWLHIAWRGILAAGLTAGVSWVVLAVFGFFKSASDRASMAASLRADARRREREQKQREKEERRRQQEWERQAPERERQQQLAAEQKRRELALRAEAQQSRDDVRYACELVYNLHAAKIAERFPQQEFRRFLKRYMNDQQPIEVVRQRASQLTETIRQHVDAVDPPERITTLGELAVWYSEQKAQLEALDIDLTYKEDYLSQLNERYADLCQRFMEEIKP